MEIIIYFKTLVLFIILSICGVVILRRATEETRAQILIPSGIIFGIAFYLFLINLMAHFVKGPPGFYLSLGIEILVAFLIKLRLKVNPIEFPPKKFMWIISLIIWGIFLYVITNHAPSDGSDNTKYFSHAQVFIRGDFPIHTPWQPDYISYNQLGVSELLGAFRNITGAPYLFIQNLIAYVFLFSLSQILTWLLYDKIKHTLRTVLIFSIPALVGLISLGGFLIAWPTQLSLPNFEGGIIHWLGQLPTLSNSAEFVGSVTTLDGFTYFLHQLMSMSFFISVLTIFFSVSQKYYLVPPAIILITFSSIALTDQARLITLLPIVLVVIFFKIFKKSFLHWVSFIFLIAFIISFQGGIVTETILNRYGDQPAVLIFPKDADQYTKNYRTFRTTQQVTKLFEDLPSFQPLRWLRPGIMYQLGVLLIICILLYFKNKNAQNKDNDKLNILLWMLFISALTAFAAYYIIVPKHPHIDGVRFLAISFSLSGLGLAFFLVHWFLNSSKKLILIKALIVWILIISIIPPLAHLFPRPKKDWFKIWPEAKYPAFEWVRSNLPVEKRLLVLTDTGPTPSGNMDLVKEVGALTPVWGPQPKAYAIFDNNPTYTDTFYTLNPELLKLLKVNYIIVNDRYLSVLNKKRLVDINNPEYFKPVMTFPNQNTIILEVREKYLQEAAKLGGTLSELAQVAPKKGAYYIDFDSTTVNRNLFRSLEMILVDREIYGVHEEYNGRVDFEIPYHPMSNDHYDYIVLGEGADPKTFCQCNNPKLLWFGTENGIQLWRTE